MLSVEAKAVEQEILEKIKDSLRYYGIRIPKMAESRSVGSVDPGSVEAAMRAALNTMGDVLIMEVAETIQSMINAVNQTAATATAATTVVPRRRALLSTTSPVAAPSAEDDSIMMAEAPAAKGRSAPVPDLATAVENLRTEVQGMLTAVEKALKAPEKFMKKLFSSVKTAAKEAADNVESTAKSMIELSKDFLSQDKEQRQAVEQLGENLQIRQLKELTQAHTILSKYRCLRERSPAALASHYRQLAAVASNNNNIDIMDVLLEDLNNNPVKDVVLDVMSEGELVIGVARLLQEVEDQQEAIQQGRLEKGVVILEMTPVSSIMLLNDMIGLTNELLGFMMMPVPMVEIDFFELEAQAPASEMGMEMWTFEEVISSSDSFWHPPEPSTKPPSSPSSYTASDVQRFRRLLSNFSDKKKNKNHNNNEDDDDDGYLSEVERYYNSYKSDALYAYNDDDLYAYQEGAFQDDWFFAPADSVAGSGDDGALLAVVIRAVTPQAGSIGLPPALLQLLLDKSGKSNEHLAALLSAAASVSAAAQAGNESTSTAELPAYNIFGPKPTTASESGVTAQKIDTTTAATTLTRQQSVVIVEQQQQHHGQHLPERLSSQARTVAIPHNSTAAGSDLSIKFWFAGVGAGFVGLLIGGIVVAVMSRGGNGADDDGYGGGGGGGRNSQDDSYLLLPSTAEQVLLPPSARKCGNSCNNKDGMKPAGGQTPRKLSNLPA